MDNFEETYDYLFKILLIGDASVGKSSILLRYTDNKFPENYMATIGIDFRIKSFTLDGKIIKL
jgi:GTPase SAR1 family protein